MFEYTFMRKAFVVGILLAIIVPCIGIIVVLKRLSMMGDALSHSSLAGIAAGLVLSINPVLGAVITSLIAAFSIEFIMSAGVGLAGVLSGFVKNSADFNSFLFGSIVAITDFELVMVIGISVLVMICFILLYKELMYMAFDEEGARMVGIPVKSVNFIFTILTAFTVSIAARTVGALIVSSMMVVPVACAMKFAKSYKQTVLFSILLALIFTIIGLTLSYYLGLKPGGTIVLSGVAFLILTIIIKRD